MVVRVHACVTRDAGQVVRCVTMCRLPRKCACRETCWGMPQIQHDSICGPDGHQYAQSAMQASPAHTPTHNTPFTMRKYPPPIHV